MKTLFHIQLEHKIATANSGCLQSRLVSTVTKTKNRSPHQRPFSTKSPAIMHTSIYTTQRRMLSCVHPSVRPPKRSSSVLTPPPFVLPSSTGTSVKPGGDAAGCREDVAALGLNVCRIVKGQREKGAAFDTSSGGKIFKPQRGCMAEQ